jgi:hypothetical protein
MNEATRSRRIDPLEYGRLILPFGAFVPLAYRPLGDSKELRREWGWTVSLGMIIVCTVLLLLILGPTGSGRSLDFDLLEPPGLFWSVIVTVLIVRFTVSALWLLRRRGRLRRIDPSPGLDERLAAADGQATLGQVRWHAWTMAIVALFFLVPAVALMDRDPSIYAPMALIFIAQTACAVRVYRFRRSQGEVEIVSVESNASGPASR